MIGIQNADGAITWVLREAPGAETTVKLAPVRHDQGRVQVKVFWKSARRPAKLVGEIVFRPEPDDFVDRPELEGRLRIDSKGRLDVQVAGVDKTVHQRFPIPWPKAKAAPAKQQAEVPGWHRPVTIGLFIGGGLSLIAALIVLIGRLVG